MKTPRIFLCLFLATLMVAKANTLQAQVEVGADVTFSVFHDNLSPYGQWVENSDYGQVWIPSEPDFVPYRTAGHWAYTDDGWTWLSDYDWGWAPFHYGRWDYDQQYGGYFWVPGYEWGPAWVSWRRSNDVYGWAPLSPGIDIGIGISFGENIPAERWTFVPHQYITYRQPNRYYVNNSRNVTIINQTTIINNVHNGGLHTVFVGGPQRAEVEKYKRRPVTRYVINNAAKPGTRVDNNTINIYRPVVNKTNVLNNAVLKNRNRQGNTKPVPQRPPQQTQRQLPQKANEPNQQPRQPLPKPTPQPSPHPRPVPFPQPKPVPPRPQPQPTPSPRPTPQPSPRPRPEPFPQPKPVPPHAQPQPRPAPTPQPSPARQPQPQPKPVQHPRPLPSPARPQPNPPIHPRPVPKLPEKKP